MSRRSRSMLAAGLLYAGLLWAALGCGEAAEVAEVFVRPPRCHLEGTLDLELGHGEADFEPFAKGQAPPLVPGLQGGVHVFLGLRIRNPALDRYETLEVRFQVIYRVLTGVCAGGAPGTGQEDKCRLVLGDRAVRLGDGWPYEVTDSGAMEAVGLLLPLDSAPDGVWEITASAEDPCGQVGATSRSVVLASLPSG